LVYTRHIEQLSESLAVLLDVVQKTVTDGLAVANSRDMMRLSRLTVLIAVFALVVSTASLVPASSWLAIWTKLKAAWIN